MQNGMFNTAQEALGFYNNSKGFFPQQINVNSTFYELLNLTDSEQAGTVTFLKTLTNKAHTKK